MVKTVISASAIGNWIAGALHRSAGTSLADKVAREDDRIAATQSGRRFSYGTRPVIRWIKGDGLDDPVTRAAIGQATRLFGDKVDYCLCTNQNRHKHVRTLLEWATQPVEWWPLSPSDNVPLAAALEAVGCPPEHYGYWWKWFPERVRERAPEWILDGDMVVTSAPSWLEQWAQGHDVCRMTQTTAGRLRVCTGLTLNWLTSNSGSIPVLSHCRRSSTTCTRSRRSSPRSRWRLDTTAGATCANKALSQLPFDESERCQFRFTSSHSAARSRI